MGLENQGAKPTGSTGRFFGILMNKFHTSLYIKYFDKKNLPDNCRILDIGCGGGKFLKYLSEKSNGFKLWGLDHSNEMIELSRQVNLEAIKQERLKLLTGSVSEIKIEDNSLNLVTAFETVQFWPDIKVAFSEIFRVLDSKGEFLIMNRFPKEGTKWGKLATLKSREDYLEKLEKAGFRDVSIDLGYKKGWIIVKGIKY